MVTPEQTQKSWDNIATDYHEYVTAQNMTLAEIALKQVDLQPGMRVLDVAAGSGALSIPAARLGAQVVATDISPVMVEQLVAQAQAEGLSNLEGRVMDGQALDLADERFDVAASQFGVMLFPDLPLGLREMARVTRSGGRVLVVAFGPPPKVEFLSLFIAAVKAVVPGFTGLPMDPPPLPFQIANPEVFRKQMIESGLSEVRIEPINYTMKVDSGQQHWDIVTSSNPIGAAMVAGLSEEQKAAVLQELSSNIHERSAGNESTILNNQVNIGIGTK